MNIFRTLLQCLAPCFLLAITVSSAQAQNSIAAIEAEYDAVDSRLFAMRDFTQKVRREGADLMALAHALDVMEELEGQLVILRQRLKSLKASEENLDEDEKGEDNDEGAEDDEEDSDWNDFLDSLGEKVDVASEGGMDVVDAIDIPIAGDDISEITEPSFDTIELVGTEGGVTDQSEWDEIEADAVNNPEDYEYIDDEVADSAGEDDDWDTVDEVDDKLYGVDQDRINDVRDQMAGQVGADAGRINAGARRDFADIEAERERRRIQKAKERAEFAAAMQELADGLSAAYYGTPQPTTSSPSPPVRSSGSTYTPPPSSSGPPSSGSSTGMTLDDYTGALKRCIDRKTTEARKSGFPIMDPTLPRMMCMDEIRNGGSGGGSIQAQNKCNQDIMTTWNPKTNRCERMTHKVNSAAKFGTRYESGGEGVHTFNYTGRPQQGARLAIEWNMYDIPDRIVVYFGSRVVLDSGMTKQTNSGRLPAFSGNSVKVVLTGGGDGTDWNFTLSE